MPGYYRVHTWRGTTLCADPRSGLIANAAEATLGPGRPAVLAWLPRNAPRLCFLVAQSQAPLPIMLAPQESWSVMLPVGLARLAGDLRVSLFHLPTRHPVRAVPIDAPDQLGNVEAGPDRGHEWEIFELVPFDASLLAASVRKPASLLDQVLDGAPTAETILNILERADGHWGGDVLNALAPLLTIGALERLAKLVLERPSLAGRLRTLLADDIWANTGLPGLAEWIASREPPPPPATVAPAGPGILHHLARALTPAGQAAGPARSGAPIEPRPRQLTLAPDLDFLADPGFHGTFASFGHACNAFARAAVQPRHDVCVISTARNEGIYILEWIAYHRAIGIEHFFFYSNDNADGSDELLSALADAGVVTWIDNRVGPGAYAQPKAYAHAFGLLPDVLDYRWALVIDLDEFFVFNPAMFGSIRDFLEWQELRAVDAIAFNWVTVGSGGEAVWRDVPVTRRFRRRIGKVNRHVKTMCRPGKFIHSRPHFPKIDERRCFVYRHASGGLHSYRNAMPDPDRAPAFADRPDAEYAAIYHYFYKSAEEFLWKFSRTRGDSRKAGTLSADMLEPEFLVEYMQQHQTADFVDEDAVARCAPDLDAEMAHLLSLPGIATANARVQQNYQKLVRALKDAAHSSPAILQIGELGRRFLEIAGLTHT